jgi:hypothetical protein
VKNNLKKFTNFYSGATALNMTIINGTDTEVFFIFKEKITFCYIQPCLSKNALTNILY